MTYYLDDILNNSDLKKVSDLIIQLIQHPEKNKVKHLLTITNKMCLKNPTFKYGETGICSVLLTMYEETKESKYLGMVSKRIYQINFDEDQLSFAVGISGYIITALHYYILSKDYKILSKIKDSVFNLYSKLNLFPNKYYLPVEIEYGTGGILLALIAIHHLVTDKKLNSETIVDVLSYEDSWIKNQSSDPSSVNRLRKKIASLKLLDESIVSSISDAVMVSKNKKMMPSPIEMYSTRVIKCLRKKTIPQFIKIEYRELCIAQLQNYFPRALSEFKEGYEYLNAFNYTTIRTNLAFIKDIEDRINQFKTSFTGLFILEKERFIYEFEKIRTQKISQLFEFEKNSSIQAINLLKESDIDLMNKSFTISKEVKLVTVNHFLPNDIEIEYYPSSEYTIALKFSVISKLDIEIVECCLQGVFAILKKMQAINKPIALGKLIDSMNAGLDEEKQSETKTTMLYFFRKLIARRYIIPCI